MKEKLTQARALLEQAALLVEEGGWPGLASEASELADAVDAAAS